MNILFIHPNFPGQFRHLASHLAQQPGNVVVGMGEHDSVARQKGSTPGVMLRGYRVSRDAAPKAHHYLRVIEQGVLQGQAALRECMALQKQGFTPDVICAHAGWGDILYIREVFPHARVIGYYEYYYRTQGADIGFDPEFPVSLDNRCEVDSKNMLHLLSWTHSDAGWSPTRWQASLFPPEFQPRISVIHEGIDTQRIAPLPGLRLTMPSGVVLSQEDEVLTLVNRNMEPYRGFHVFMRALPEIQRQRPKAHTIIVGSEFDVSYGNRPPGGKSWREVLLEEVGDALDMSRIHFVGQLPHEAYLKVLQLSRAHVYMSYPYILSWSMLEAMACGCLVIGSNTAPVAEVIRHGENGLLFDFFDRAALVDQVCDALANPLAYARLRENARRTIVEQYDLATVCLPRQLGLIETVRAS